MRVIPVLDIRQGRPVHARGGRREGYEPVASVLGPCDRPADLAATLQKRLGILEVYVADLDAIEGLGSNRADLEDLARLGLRVWADVGLRGAVEADPLIAAGVHSVIAATETLAGPSALAALIDAVGPERLVFGLDLRAGVPILAPGACWLRNEPTALIERAVAVGCRRVLLLDLARVGSGRGVGTLGLVREARASWPGLEVAVGGGIGGIDEVLQLRDAGADAVLVASALHDGRIGPRELERLA